MSKKGCSPDNSAREVFFGRLKNEFFYYRSWEGATFEEFVAELGAYIEHYNEGGSSSRSAGRARCSTGACA